MLTQKGLFFRSLGNYVRLATDRLIQPASYLASEANQKARLFNILLLVEFTLFLFGLAVTLLFSNSSRLFSVTAILLTGAALTYTVAKGGSPGLAAWLNTLTILAALTYYNLQRSPDDALTAYQDFRPGNVLLILPILIAGIAVSYRICLAIMVPVIIISLLYGKKMMRLNKYKNDELEKQVDIISTGNNTSIRHHYNNLRKWQVRISDKEAWNFGFMEIMVLLVIAVSLIVSKNLHSTSIMAGSLFGIYSYILKFASGLDTIPYTMERLSSLSDITRRIELEVDDMPEEVKTETERFRILPRNSTAEFSV